MTKLSARARVGLASATLLLGSSAFGVIAVPAPAAAVTVPNQMLCEPDTGWCFQTNPPAVAGIPHYCRWDYKLSGLHSGMWYTGCDYWGPEIH